MEILGSGKHNGFTAMIGTHFPHMINASDLLNACQLNTVTFPFYAIIHVSWRLQSSLVPNSAFITIKPVMVLKWVLVSSTGSNNFG